MTHPYQLPELLYPYNALEPYIDAQTMEIHHTKHHQAYIDKLNTALEKYPDLQGKTVEELLQSWNNLQIEEADKTAIKNHGGGHANHSLFWRCMSPDQKTDDVLVGEIVSTFGSVEEFKKRFTQSAMGQFGSGWAWLARDETGKLQIYSTSNQDSPLLTGHTPIFGIDVWEHAYYLQYQNKRQEYVNNWWNTLAWKL